MNRFAKRNIFIQTIRKSHISFLVFLGLIALFVYGISNISNTTTEKQEESLKNALNRDIVHCYCVEGTYPPSLAYLVEHYGLTYDEDLFYIDYVAYGSNIIPDVTIIKK